MGRVGWTGTGRDGQGQAGTGRAGWAVIELDVCGLGCNTCTAGWMSLSNIEL